MTFTETAGGRGATPEKPSAAGSPIFDQLLREHPEHAPAVLDALYAPAVELTAGYTGRHVAQEQPDPPLEVAVLSTADGTVLSWE